MKNSSGIQDFRNILPFQTDVMIFEKLNYMTFDFSNPTIQLTKYQYLMSTDVQHKQG